MPVIRKIPLLRVGALFIALLLTLGQERKIGEEKEGVEAEASSNKGKWFEPAYLKLYRSGELKKRAKELWAMMER